MRAGVAVFLLCLASLPASAATRYAPAQQQEALNAPGVDAARRELGELARGGNAHQLAHYADRLLTTAAAAPLESEYLLSEWLVALRARPREPLLQVRVENLTRYSAKALGPSPEPHRSDRWLPLFDVASQARGTLRAWQLSERLATVRAALAAGTTVSLQDAEALAIALETAPRAELEALRGQALPSRAGAVVARRLGDPAIYRSLFARPPDAFTILALAEAGEVLPRSVALDLLREASRQPALASAAVLAMGKLDPPLGELVDCLGDAQRGSSCAQLLAARQDGLTFEALTGLAKAGREDAATRRALLALWWSDSRRARQFLQGYGVDAAMPAAMREQVNRWLR